MMDAHITSSNARAWFSRAALVGMLCAVSGLLAGCAGGEPCDDKITLGTGGCGGSGDAVTVDYPIFYIKRPLSTATPQAGGTLRVRIREFEPGADLYMRISASPSAGETNLTGHLTNGRGDVRDVDVSHDGRRVVFAMRFPFTPNVTVPNQTASWDIWEYNLDTRAVTRVITDIGVDNEGHDRFPHYSADDQRIIFSSTRQRTSQAVLLDEGKGQFQAIEETNSSQEPISVLHSMEARGLNMRQLTFNQAHDMDSTLLANGQIAFTRWDTATTTRHIALYRMNPDGTGVELLYGKQNSTHAINPDTAGTSSTPVQFLRPRLLRNGQISAIARPFDGRDIDEGGDLVRIDVDNYVEFRQAAAAGAGLGGPAHTRLAPALAVNTEPGPSPGGRYRSMFPLNDGTNRILVSWSQCRLINGATVVPCTAQNLAITPALQEARPLYGIYIYNLDANTQLPIAVPEEGTIMTDVVAGAPRSMPPLILDRRGGIDYPTQLDAQSAGILDIRSVYDIRGIDTAPGGITVLRNPQLTTADERPARFLRIEKAVSLPSTQIRNVRRTSFSPIGGNTGRFMREIIGYAPIEPDGSVRVKVPANIAFQISILDANGRRLTPPTAGLNSPHANWLHVRPGEVMTCTGCHTRQTGATTVSHGRRGSFASANPGLPANTSGIFQNTVNALWGDVGQTMAQVRAQRMCDLDNGACNPSVNMIYTDYWTDPAVRAPDTAFGRCYTANPTDVRIDPLNTSLTYTCAAPTASALQTLAPVRDACETAWSAPCRIVINYAEHIQPLWDVDRFAVPGDPTSTNNQCVNCHSTNAVRANFTPGTCEELVNGIRVPCGQLDLSGTPDANEADHLVSYRQLLFTRRARELDATMMVLQDICLDTDVNTGVCLQFDDRVAPMRALSALGSSIFFTAMNNATHSGFMNPAELRLISEWLDIGAQYYNDPFLAPVQ